MNYDFSTLNNKDFEELSVDLLNAHFLIKHGFHLFSFICFSLYLQVF